jgi:hypothetical protein
VTEFTVAIGGRLACSYFDPEKGALYAMEDTDENSHFDLTLQSERIGMIQEIH